MATAALVAALVLPYFHTDAELADWQADWSTRVEAAGALDDHLLDEWMDMRSRHLCQLADICPNPQVRAQSTQRTSGVYRGMGSNVEQWRSLVAVFFPAERVDAALRVMGCESGGNADAKNRRSTAAGLYQFLRDTWNRTAVPLGYGDYASGAVFDPAANIHAASVLSRGGSDWGAWSCRWAV